MGIKNKTVYLYSYLISSNNIIAARFIHFSQVNKIGHYKLMFTKNFSCVNIGTRNIARFVGIYTGSLGDNKLLGYIKVEFMDWNYLIIFAICLSFFFIMVKLFEIDAKLKILLSQKEIDWSEQFNEEIHTAILSGDHTKAAKLLRNKTGLSFVYCLDIVKKHDESVA
ncbi:hypothetical protein [Pseudoalteromonas sp. MTN2-4]|uniref:hypothetical protein n=1 Tax=Pseudoalteromonas sp. MTN2-4 TaxID=3056555 RepID=UPI0036F3CE3D